MTDWYTDELFINGIGKPLVAPVSRLISDMERFKDDMKEEMSTVGMGICYTRTHNLFRLSHKLEMIRKYYDPYHLMLSHYTDEALKEHKHALVIDCHSFSNTPYKCDKNPRNDRPDICIGTDPVHTPDEIINIIMRGFQISGYDVKLDYPFSGTIIPEEFENNTDLFSVMIEINRKLYLDWNDGNPEKKEKEFLLLKARIKEIRESIAEFMDSSGSRDED